MDELIFTVLAVALGVAAAIVHILPAVIEIRKTQVIATVGAVVHSAWLAALFFAGAELDVITLCFMASLLLYCFIAWLQYRRSPEWREHREQRAAEVAAEAKKRADRKAAEATTPKETEIAEPESEIAKCDSITEPEAEIAECEEACEI